MSKAVAKASEVTVVAMTMVLPMLFGYWLDRFLGTLPLFVLCGLVLGMPAGIVQLIKLVNRTEDPDGR
jgi:F0F1-type ATP synthase assembly protein I